MFDIKKTIVGAVAAGLLAFGTTSVQAANAVTSWDLFNFPSGQLGSPDYGLRLDGLFGDTNREWTFSFEDGSGNSTVNMTLFDDSTLTLSGQIYGGEDVGSSYAAGSDGIWNIDFTYTGVSFDSGASDSLPVTKQDSSLGNKDSTAVGSGTLESTYNVMNGSTNEGMGTINFVAHADGSGLFFEYALGLIQSKCNPTANPVECSRAIGVGWLTHGEDYGVDVVDNQTTRHASSDFQFTGDVSAVPLPASILFMIAGLAGLGALKIRRTA